MYTALVIGFSRTNYSVNESDGNVTLTIRVRGDPTECEEEEWRIHFNTTALSAQCKDQAYMLLMNEAQQPPVFHIIHSSW